MAPQKRRHTVILAVCLSLVVVAVWLIVRADSTSRPVRGAGSATYVRPVGSLRLVASMPGRREDAGTTDAASDSIDGPDAGGKPTASEIEAAIRQKLRDMGLPADQIRMHVEGRKVTLEGVVETPLTRDAIEVAARSVRGVHRLENRIELSKTPGR